MIKQRPLRSSATVAAASTKDVPKPAAAEPAAAAPPARDADAGTDAPPSTDRQTTVARSRPTTSRGEADAAQLGERIGQKLKSMFDDLVAEPVPEKFQRLLEELERKSGKS
jgi:anti-sigma factor NepR-like protein